MADRKAPIRHPSTHPRAGGEGRPAQESARVLSHRRIALRLPKGGDAPRDGDPPATPGQPPPHLHLDLFHGDAFAALAETTTGSLGAVITDPPFGVTDLAWDKALEPTRMLAELHRVTRPDGAVVVFTSGVYTQRLLAAAGRTYRYKLIWRKLGQPTGGLNCRRFPLRAHEDIVVLGLKQPRYFPVMTRGGKPYKVRPSKSERWGAHWGKSGPKIERQNHGERYPIDVLDFARPHGAERFHPTQKPVDLLERLVRLFTEPGDVVGDPFFGSGATARACLRAGRSFRGSELDAGYFTAATSAIESEAVALGLEPAL